MNLNHTDPRTARLLRWIAPLFCLLCLALPLRAQAQAQVQPAETRALLPVAQLGGAAKLTFWGFEVYNAALWVEPDFRHDSYAEHEFCLELSYLRDFSNSDIAKRSIEEIRRTGNLTDEQAQRWQKLLQASYPSVKKGDRIVGVNLPGKGMVFFTNGQKTGEITDLELTRRFFSIWLAPTTSEPSMRLALLARTRP